MSSNQSRQNYRSDIPKGRSTSRIKNASRSQGFANKDLYGPTVQTGYSNATNRQTFRTEYANQRASQGRGSDISNKRKNEYKKYNYDKQPERNKQGNSNEMSDSTIMKVIIGSILAAVILAIVIIISLSFMDFQL